MHARTHKHTRTHAHAHTDTHSCISILFIFYLLTISSWSLKLSNRVAQQIHTDTLISLGSHSKASCALLITTDEMFSLINTSLSSSSLAEEKPLQQPLPMKTGHELESTYSIQWWLMVGSNRKRVFVIVSLDGAVRAAAAVSVQRTQSLKGPEQRPTPALEGPHDSIR